MICTRCLARCSLRPAPKRISTIPNHSPLPTRSISSTASHSHAASKTPISADGAATSHPNRSPPPATSTSAAQPFSAPSTPNLSKQAPSDPRAGPSKKGGKPAQSAKPAIRSSVPAGKPLKGLNYFKGKEDPVAMEDHEYPEWLWTVLEEKKTKGEGDEEADPRLYSKSAKARRMARKRLRVKAEENPEMMQSKTPLYEQTVDLPADPAQTGVGKSARHELQRSMRNKRRGDIKTDNFLRAMR